MVHCWDEYLAKAHKAVPVDPWATNVQLLDVFVEERSSSSWLPAWLHKRKAHMARVGSMLTLGIQPVKKNIDGGASENVTLQAPLIPSHENDANTNNSVHAIQDPNKANDDDARLMQPINSTTTIDKGILLTKNASSNDDDHQRPTIFNSLVIKKTNMPDMQTSIKSSTSLLASFTGGSSITGQFDAKGSKTVSCNIAGVESRWLDIDTLIESLTFRTFSGLPPLWRPDISLPQLQWSSKRGQTLWVVIEIMYANKIKIEGDNQVQSSVQAKVSKGTEISVSSQVDASKDGVWIVTASHNNPIFPFALRLLKLDYDTCGNIITAKSKECLHRSNSLNNKIKRVSSKHMAELYCSSSVSHILP